MEHKNVFLIKPERFLMCFSKAQRVLHYICEALPMKAAARSWRTCGPPWPEETLHFGKRGRENRKDEKYIYKRRRDLCGWLEPREGRTSCHHTLHGHIHEVRVRLQSMMQCPHVPRARWKHDSWAQTPDTSLPFLHMHHGLTRRTQRKSLSLRTYLFQSLTKMS